MSSEDEAEGVRALMALLIKATLVLVRLDEPSPEEPSPARRGSGVVIKHGGRAVVLSCAHLLQHGRWAVEIDEGRPPVLTDAEVFAVPPEQRRTLLGVLRPARTLGADARWDFAWAPFEPVPDDLNARIAIYSGPLAQRPRAGDPHTFVAWNRDLHIPSARVVERQAAYETHMEYVGEDDQGMDRFRLAADHKGHDYYRGASGAPVADPTGVIVGLLAHGREAAAGMLTAVPLAKAIAAMGHRPVRGAAYMRRLRRRGR